MAFDWKEFYDIALVLNQIKQTKQTEEKEGYNRVIINRFYYSSYNKLKEYLLQNYGYKSSKTGTHSDLLEEMKYHRDVKIKRMFKKQLTLMMYREQVDYYRNFYQHHSKKWDPQKNENIKNLENAYIVARDKIEQIFNEINV